MFIKSRITVRRLIYSSLLEVPPSSLIVLKPAGKAFTRNAVDFSLPLDAGHKHILSGLISHFYNHISIYGITKNDVQMSVICILINKTPRNTHKDKSAV